MPKHPERLSIPRRPDSDSRKNDTRGTLHREAPELARDADHVVIDGPPRIAGLMRSALLAADLVLIPAQPSPFDGWASGEILRLIDEARIFRRQTVIRFVLNRCGARTVIARETAEAWRITSRRRSPRASASAWLLPMRRNPAGSSGNSLTTARLRARSPRSPSKSEGSHDDQAATEAWLCIPPGQSRVVDPHSRSIGRSRFR
jgi:cellulose biosynthesis protein BcsQ